MLKAVFLDRDGTINIDKGYVSKPADFEFETRAIEGLMMLKRAGYALFIITNQSGIGRGYYSERDFWNVHQHMCAELKKCGITIEGVFFCPHKPEDGCRCRKPSVGMLEKATSRYAIDLSKSWVIGDKTADIKLAENFGLRGILVMTGISGRDKIYKIKPAYLARDLVDAAQYIISNPAGERA